MPTTIAIKKLTKTDLTLFATHYHADPVAKQKAINLNKDPLVKTLYPSLPRIATDRGGRLPIDLSIYGPGLGERHNLQRKILKEAKNWRLDGEIIYGPEGEPGRYDELQPNDVVILEFSSPDGLVPDSCKLFLLSESHAEDSTPLRAARRLLAGKSMVAVECVELEKAVGVATGHPIDELLISPTLEEAAAGGESARREVRRRRPRMKVERGELKRAREAAELNGRLGEVAVNVFLTEQLGSEAFEWTADQDALAPFDFAELREESLHEKLEVKTTSASFSQPFHVSRAELEEATGETPYRIYRVFELSEGAAKLRVSEPINTLARQLVKVLDTLPLGVVADSVSVDPQLKDLTWGHEKDLSLPREEEDDSDAAADDKAELEDE